MKLIEAEADLEDKAAMESRNPEQVNKAVLAKNKAMEMTANDGNLMSY